MNREHQQELKKAIQQITSVVDNKATDLTEFNKLVLSTLFYKFLSEQFVEYMEGGDGLKYETLTSEDISDDIREDVIKTKGYFIEPRQTFNSLVATNAGVVELAKTFKSIELSAAGFDSHKIMNDLFMFDMTVLGSPIDEQSDVLRKIIKHIDGLSFKYNESDNDIIGDAYEFLLVNQSKTAGQKHGEFYTPQSISKLVAAIATHNQDSINKFYDPSCGSGSLLLQAKKSFDNIVTDGYYGQEINPITQRLAKMNLLLNNVSYDKFDIELGDTLLNPGFMDEKFDAIVSNPPYSVKWGGDSKELELAYDVRFKPTALAPNSKADLAFIMHIMYLLSDKGRAAAVVAPGILYRGGREQKIRKYLVDSNYIEAIIALPPKLFINTPIPVNIVVLSKCKADKKIHFIDVSGDEYFDKVGANAVLSDEHVQKVLDIYKNRLEIDYTTKVVDYEDVVDNDYNLSTTPYIDIEPKPVVDVESVQLELERVIQMNNDMRMEIGV